MSDFKNAVNSWKFVIILILFSLGACQVNETSSVDNTKAEGMETLTPTLTPTVSLTQTSKPTINPTPVLPKLTPSPTATPTPVLPVHLGTQLPKPSNSLNLQNIADIRELARYSGSANTLIRVSNDYQFLVTGSNGGIDIYNLRNNDLLEHINTHISSLWNDEYQPYSMGISEKADLVFIVSNEFVEVYSQDGDLVYQYPIQFDTCSENMKYMWIYAPELVGGKAALSPDGKFLAVNICETFFIVNLLNGETIYTWDNDYLSLHGVPLAFSPDNSMLAVEIDNHLWIWSVDGWENTAKYYLGFELLEPSLGYSWAFSPDSTLLAIAYKDEVKIWNIKENDVIRGFVVEGQPQIKFSDDSSKIGMAYWDGSMEVWDLDGKLLISDNQTDVQNITQTQITAEGKIILYRIPDKDLSLWRGGSTKDFGFLEDQQSLYLTGEDNCLISLSGKSQCWLSSSIYPIAYRNYWYFWNGEEFFQAEIDFTTVNIFNNDENILSFLISGDWAFTPEYFDTIHDLIFYTVWETPNFSKSYIRDSAKNQVIKEWIGSIDRVVISPDKRLAAFFIKHNPKAELIIFNLVEKKVLFRETFLWGGDDLSFSPDSQLLAFSAIAKEDYSKASNENIYPVYIMNIDSPDDRSRYELATDVWGIPALEYSADGSFLAVSHINGTISILDSLTGDMIYEWLAHPARIDGLSFSSNGKLLATYSKSGFISIWGIWP
ncbi:MAG: WD40 repeat domain-containing protein [Candidatus Hodarchaeales archaeon]